jgi:epoxide hydrolase-like protein
MSSTIETSSNIRPFHVDIPDEALEDLRRRIAATNWPEKETVADQSQGVPLAMIQKLARYWMTDYDWRTCEANLNAYRSSSPRSTGWTFTSFTFVRSMKTRCARPSFPASSIKRRAAGRSRPTPTSFTSTKSTEAAASPPGSSPICLSPRSGRRSDHCASPTEPDAAPRLLAVPRPAHRATGEALA